MVEVGDGVGLVADEVVESVGRVGVDEAVADPFARSDGLVDVCDDLEGGLDAVFVGLAGVQAFYVCFSREAQDVEGIFAGQCD